jgi:hypothetical protein
MLKNLIAYFRYRKQILGLINYSLKEVVYYKYLTKREKQIITQKQFQEIRLLAVKYSKKINIMEERECQEKRNTDRIIEQAKYRVSMKRKLRQSGIPSSLIRNASTEDLESILNQLNY